MTCTTFIATASTASSAIAEVEEVASQVCSSASHRGKARDCGFENRNRKTATSERCGVSLSLCRLDNR